MGPGSRGGPPERSRFWHAARLGSLASSRMMAKSTGRGSRSGTVSAARSVAGTSACSGGGTSQAVSDRPHRRRAEDEERDVMASITSAAGADERLSCRGAAYGAARGEATGGVSILLPGVPTRPRPKGLRATTCSPSLSTVPSEPIGKLEPSPDVALRCQQARQDPHPPLLHLWLTLGNQSSTTPAPYNTTPPFDVPPASHGVELALHARMKPDRLS